MKINKGDTVKVLYGKEAGKTGVVTAINPKNNMLVVEGLNLYKRHLKGDGKTRTSEILTIEKPFPLSKVMFICPLCGKATRLAIRKEEKDGKSIITRVCKKCGKDIPTIEKKEEVKKEKPKKEKEEKEKNNKTNKK